MRPVLRILLTLYLLSMIAIILIPRLHWQTICGSDIHMQRSRSGFIYQSQLDFRTGTRFDFSGIPGLYRVAFR